jgi:hypothetical protein
MPVVHVGIVRMAVGKLLMYVWMRVRLTTVPRKVVRVLVMFVMPVAMRVRRRFMRVRVFMAFSQVKPDAASHERGGDPEWH